MTKGRCHITGVISVPKSAQRWALGTIDVSYLCLYNHIDPSVFADGISTEERIRIIKELAESVNAMQAVLKLVA